MVKNSTASVGDKTDVISIPGWGRFSGVGKGSQLQYSCLENTMDRGACWAIVLGVTESDTTERLNTRMGSWEHLIDSWSVRSTDNSLDLRLASEVEAVLLP